MRRARWVPAVTPPLPLPRRSCGTAGISGVFPPAAYRLLGKARGNELVAAAMAQGPGCLEGFGLPNLRRWHKTAGAEPTSWSWGGTPSLCPTSHVLRDSFPALWPALVELTRCHLSPQGCLLQRGLHAQPGARREHQVLAGVIRGLVFPGESQRGLEPLRAVRRQPQHPGREVRDPQPVPGTATSVGDRPAAAPPARGARRSFPPGGNRGRLVPAPASCRGTEGRKIPLQQQTTPKVL